MQPCVIAHAHMISSTHFWSKQGATRKPLSYATADHPHPHPLISDYSQWTKDAGTAETCVKFSLDSGVVALKTLLEKKSATARSDAETVNGGY